jgi:phenylacetate-CoA ligase
VGPADYLRRAKLETYCALKGLRRFRYYRELKRHESMSPSELQALQWQKLKAMLDHAYTNVPFYRRLFEELSAVPKDFSSPTDLARLPILDRSTVRANRESMLSRNSVPETYHPHSTGGSSGEPLDFYRPWEYEEYSNAAGGYRSARRAGWHPGERIVWIWGAPAPAPAPAPASAWGRARARIGEWLRDGGTIVCNAFDADDRSMHSWWEMFRQKRPRYVLGYTSALTNFALFLERSNLAVGDIRGVVSTAERIYPEQRALLQRILGGALIDQYGSREICSIATSCREGSMHINSDLVHVEFVADQEAPGMHRLVITDLHNMVFPFIRYEIGDTGSPEEGSCSCGLPFPRMRMEIGRVFDNFISPEGRVVHGAFFKNLMDGVPGVTVYQFRQVEADRIVLLLKPGAGFGQQTEDYLQKVRARIASEFSVRARLEVRHVEEVPRTRMGKLHYTICELGDRSGRPGGIGVG